ncbi:hypothetical protein [Paraliomyxa miuraensis]|uniref:hypothetical protein n=1 Tax=Paraliomyxa miuraensis TaxID=376150 RepID=UPI00224DBBF9|nr:hypothetical protein [Paraliomyxa miuraensis]MCX4245032.1 hypothetical protein [Paraliomyxa miuraensis]
MTPRPRPHLPVIRRVVPPGVIPVELWDLELGHGELGHGILWDHMGTEALPAALVQAIEHLRRGTAITRSRVPIPPRCRELTAVWLAGGHAVALDPSPLSAALGLPVWRADEPTAVAEHGARALLPEAPAPAVIDLGQSRLKIFLSGERFVYERPWDRLAPLDPFAPGAPVIDPAAGRARLRAWVSEALADASARIRQLRQLRRSRGPTDAVIIALPCALADTPTPGSCSYPGLEGDSRFVADVLATAGWTPRTVLVLNDAELAAAAASLDPRCRDAVTLVLTLGFGAGGALLLP